MVLISQGASVLSGVVGSLSSHTAADSVLLEIRNQICSRTVLSASQNL